MMMRLSSAAAFLVATLLLATAQAQAGPHDVGHDPYLEPVGQLKPEHVLKPETPEADPVPAAPPPPVEEVQIQNPSGIDARDVSADDLSERIGLLSGDQGVGENVWQYLQIDQARALLAQLPTPMPDGGLRDVVIKLLTTEARPPRGTAKGWLHDRVQALIRIGAIDDAAALLDRVPDSAFDAPLVKTHTLVMMLAGRTGQACDRVRRSSENKKHPLSPSLGRFLIYCQAQDGNFEQSELAISLKRETKDPYPEWFSSLIDAMQYPDSELQSMPEKPQPLDIAMVLAAAPQHLPQGVSLHDFAQSAYQPYHELLGASALLSASQRVGFVESSVAAGNPIGRKEIETLYRSVIVSGKPTNAEIEQRIRTYLKLVDAPNTKTALRDFYDALKAFGHNHALARRMLTGPLGVLSSTMRPEQPYLAYAPQAFAMLLAEGKLDDTGKWLRMMDVHREASAITYVSHELARFVTSTDKHLSPGAKQLPPFAIPDHADRDELRLLQRYFRIIPLFGYHTPDITTSMLDEKLDPITRNLAAWPVDELKAYADAGDMAGVVLRSAAFMKGADWLEVNDEGLHMLVASLIASGQKPLARSILVESLLAFIQ